MDIDKLLEFSDSGDFANETGTANIGDVIDLGIADRDPGLGRPMYLIVSVDTAMDGGGGAAATVAFQLVSDSTSTIAVDGTQTVHLVSKPHVAADLTIGKVLVYPLPSGLSYERFLGLQIVTAVEGEDALVCSAWLSHETFGNRAMPEAVN